VALDEVTIAIRFEPRPTVDRTALVPDEGGHQSQSVNVDTKTMQSSAAWIAQSSYNLGFG
jgi:hypothetical protein